MARVWCLEMQLTDGIRSNRWYIAHIFQIQYMPGGYEELAKGIEPNRNREIF